MTGTVFSFRLSKWEAAAVVIYLALGLAYLQYIEQERQAYALGRIGGELQVLRQHLEDLRDQDPDDDFELSDCCCGYSQ